MHAHHSDLSLLPSRVQPLYLLTDKRNNIVEPVVAHQHQELQVHRSTPGLGTCPGSARSSAIVGMRVQNTSPQLRHTPRLYGFAESRCRKCSYVVMLRLLK